jgi:DNA-binding response OmpR family regulator
MIDLQHSKGAVLVVDDEPTIGEIVSRYLIRAGYQTRVVMDGLSALTEVDGWHPDLIVLDLMLPGIDGLEVLRRLRAGDKRGVAVILLTARGEPADRITGLRLGADDYVAKPFSPAELIARVDAVLRRVETSHQPEPPLIFGELRIDPQSREVTVEGSKRSLTQREFDLLHFLARHPGQVFTRSQLMDHVWNFSFYTDTATVTVHIRRLRAKVEPDPANPRYVETVWGVGYRFNG